MVLQVHHTTSRMLIDRLKANKQAVQPVEHRDPVRHSNVYREFLEKARLRLGSGPVYSRAHVW